MTSKEFAKIVGVSQPTVSRALNNSDLVPKEKREYIQQKAQEYGFVLNSQAKSLRTNKTGTIGILFPKHFVSMNSNLMLAHLYDSIQKEMSQYDYDIMVIHYDYEADDFSSFERIIRKKKVDGFIVMRMELSDLEMKLIEQYKVPCVFIMNAGMKVRANLNYLFSDSEYGGYLAGEYLGQFPDYQKVFMTIREETEDAERRFKGYCRGLNMHGYELAQSDILYCNLSMESAYRCIEKHVELFKGKKTAIHTYSDILGIGAVNALKDYGFKIPHDVQIIGMDDIPLASWVKPQLSTIHVEIEEMVSKGCEVLIDLIEKKDVMIQKWIKPRMILRSTTMILPE